MLILKVAGEPGINVVGISASIRSEEAIRRSACPEGDNRSLII
jgi:hypothetical protein